MRKRVFGLQDIHHYDTYVPMVGDILTDIEWNEAVDNILSALAPLGEEYISILREGLGGGRWCDRYENKGKRSGAFSYGTYTSPPYIMMNYKADVFSDVYTLAHEAGHSMHTWYSHRTQKYQNDHYPIFLAEVASTFNEILLTEHLLNASDEPKMRPYVMNRQVDDLRGTLYRQTMFAEFEKAITPPRRPVNPPRSRASEKSTEVCLTPILARSSRSTPSWSWKCPNIPHFYSAFYVYKYATEIRPLWPWPARFSRPAILPATSVS